MSKEESGYERRMSNFLFILSSSWYYAWRMTANNPTPVPVSSARRRARWLRIIAIVALVLGIFGADLVYWLGTRTVDEANPLPLAGEDKVETRRAEMLFGRQTVWLDEWGRDLKQPGAQAVIIFATAALVAGGCFYFARLLDSTD
jgi:hypothetical protein